MCGNDLRLTVHNGLPWATTLTVHTTIVGSGTSVPRVESWSLAAGESRSHEFHIDGATSTPASPRGEFHSLQVQVGSDIHLHASICPEATA
ncbi:MAG TPA: hypothetical protein VHI93_05540 [Candidatus Thermoplasmatota archaeon]|nr:hypothetical protein [Candidatus Thermoplasmatota archaeon]